MELGELPPTATIIIDERDVEAAQATPATFQASTRAPRRSAAARKDPAPLFLRGGQVNEGNRCYRNATNAALVRDVRFCAHLASLHPCAAWQTTLRVVTDALRDYLSGRGALSVSTAQPLAAIITAVMLPSSEFFIGARAADKLRTALPAARVELVAAAVKRGVQTHLRLTVAGDGVFALPQGDNAAAEAAAPTFMLQTPALAAAATSLRALSSHAGAAPLRYAAGTFNFANYGSRQQCAADYLEILLRRVAIAYDPTPLERQQLPPCCVYHGFSSKLSTIGITCHGAVRHTWVPQYQADNEHRTIVSLNIPGAITLVHDSDAAASVSLASCFDLSMHEVVNVEKLGDGRRCEGCNANNVGYTTSAAFTDLPEGLLLQLSRGTSVVGIAGNKNFRHVALPDVLDMVPYVKLPVGAHSAAAALAAARGALRYRLVAVVVHEGATSHSGHYYTYRRALPEAIGSAPAWERWNDSDVTGVTWATVAAAPAFLVVYEAINADLLRTVFPRAAVVLPMPVPQAAAGEAPLIIEL